MDTNIKHALQCLKLDITIHNYQQQVIESYGTGLDTFCVAGTGRGKSLTYILCPFIHDYLKYGESTSVINLESVIIVIQPLTSLMKDQVAKLKALGLKATYVGEEQDFSGMDEHLYNYIIASPETAVTPKFQEVLQKLKGHIKCIFIDESHCIQSL